MKRKGDPVAFAVQGRSVVERERNLVESTIGEAVRIMMDDSSKIAPDLAAIYRRNGGKNTFTISLLSEAFGKRGVSLRPGAPPDFNKLASTLTSKAKAISRKNLTTPGRRSSVTTLGGVRVVQISRSTRTPSNAVFRISKPGTSAVDVDIEDVIVACGSDVDPTVD